jgi:hypothetical protein
MTNCCLVQFLVKGSNTNLLTDFSIYSLLTKYTIQHCLVQFLVKGSNTNLLTDFSIYSLLTKYTIQHCLSLIARVVNVLSLEHLVFTRLVDSSPTEVSFLADSSLLERLCFSIIRWDRHAVDETVEAFIEAEGDHLECSYAMEKGKVRTVARMLLMPTKSDASFLRAKHSTGSFDETFEAPATSHQERLSSNIRLLRAAYAFIPTVRAPPVSMIFCKLFSIRI